LPDAWTLTVKVNDSGDDEYLFGGPANLAFDRRGYAWITNNVVQGSSGSSNAVMVLQPDGQPADGTGGTPVSPIHNDSIIGTGFGVDVDPTGAVWFGNFGWGGVNPEPPQGSIVKLSPSGQILSGPQGFSGGPNRAQATVSDARGNIWIASYGNDSVYVFPEGDPARSMGFKLYPGSGPFGIAIAPDGSAWVSNSGGLAGSYPSSVARFSLVGGRLHPHFVHRVGKGLKGLGVDSRGNAWVASLGDSKVYGLRPDGSLIGAFSGGGIDSPWDVTIDGDDNLWVANFGPLTVPPSELPNNFPNGRLSKLAGIDPARRPPGTHTGEALSPHTGYTVPSAGSPVLLHNGEPLYGPGAPPSFAPMMRQTAAVIDRAGNVWTLNNWKPLFAVDADPTGNPGGDGIVIFVGLGAPPRSPR
jgi:sugar lactone lactonase YvrE